MSISKETNLFKLETHQDRRKWILDYVLNETDEAILDDQRIKDAFQLFEKISKIEQILSELKEARNNYKLQLRRMVDTINSDSEHELIQFMYWYFNATGESKTAYYLKISPIIIPYISTCKACGESQRFELIISTLSELDRITRSLHSSSVNCACKRASIQEAENRVKVAHERREELKTMPYQEYLQTPEWQETRKAMLRKAKYKCQLCYSNGTLHVHHKTYERRGDEDYNDLIVLCENCHAKFHEKVSKGN